MKSYVKIRRDAYPVGMKNYEGFFNDYVGELIVDIGRKAQFRYGVKVKFEDMDLNSDTWVFNPEDVIFIGEKDAIKGKENLGKTTVYESGNICDGYREIKLD